MRFPFTAVTVLLPFVTFPAGAVTIDFENLSDSELLTTQFSGVSFSNARVLTAGISLNEIEFPPRSGVKVAFDDSGPMSLDFSLPVSAFQGFFTYSQRLNLSAFDATNNPLGSASSMFNANLGLSGDPGSSPNEPLGISGPGNIARVVIEGSPSGGSFALDDVSFTPVPEPATLQLAGVALAAIAAFRARLRRN